jgi:3-hydroxyisobutyrate dehydrogenase-like beta-hydroxyacid dehydrogenase
METVQTTRFPTSVGFAGLGTMGGGMAGRLLDAGFTVHGWNRTPGRSAHLAQRGLITHATPRDLAGAVDIVFTSLADDGALETVASGPAGILAGLTAGQIWVDLSTVNPLASRALAERVRARGAWLLDSPVSGSVPQVEAGTLTIMVGGDPDAYARAEATLRRLGTPTRVGGNGLGLVLKLAINISLAVQMLAFSEGVLLAERAGIERELAVGVMAGSAIGSPMLKARAGFLSGLPEEAWFDLRMMHKDIALALEVARQEGVPLPTGAAAGATLDSALTLGYERRDLAALLEVLARIADGRVPAAA